MLLSDDPGWQQRAEAWRRHCGPTTQPVAAARIPAIPMPGWQGEGETSIGELVSIRPELEAYETALRDGTVFEEMSARASRYLRATGLADQPRQVFGVCTPVDDQDPGVWSVLHLANEATCTAGRAHLAGAPAPDQPLVLHVKLQPYANRWVQRQPGEPRPLAEDVVGAFVTTMRVPPEACLGATRAWEFGRTRRTSDEDPGPHFHLEDRLGHVVLPISAGTAVYERFEELAPVAFPPGSGGIHVERIDLQTVLAARDGGRTDVPRTAEELLAAHLEIVGIDPADCYGVGMGDTGTLAVLTRDRPEHAAGRDRFARWAASLGFDLRAELVPDVVRSLTGSAPVPGRQAGKRYAVLWLVALVALVVAIPAATIAGGGWAIVGGLVGLFLVLSVVGAVLGWKAGYISRGDRRRTGTEVDAPP